MGKREQKWDELLNSGPLHTQIHEWMNSNSSYFQVTSSDFRNIGAKPVRLIPTYSFDELPPALLDVGLEQIRNQKGGCLLIKRAQLNFPSLFPALPEIEVIEMNKPPKFPVKLKLLKHDELHNEETGIVLAKEFGLYDHFFKEAISLDEPFTLGGRIKTTVDGEFLIGGEKIPVTDCLLEIDNFLECSSVLVPVEAKISSEKKTRTSFSIHQFALPTLLLSQYSSKRIYSLFQIYSVQRAEILSFKFYLYDMKYSPGVVDPHSYSFVNGFQYLVHYDRSMFL